MALDNLPKDPMMLLSFVNTRLRDDGISLSEFCSQFDVSEDQIKDILGNISYEYDDALNKFI